VFVGTQLAHLGKRAREACERPRAAFRFGAPRRVDVTAADDDFDLRQFTLNRAGDTLDQRDAGGRRRIVGAIDSGASAHLPFGNRGARCLVSRIDRNWFGADVHPVGGQRLLALLDRGVAFAFQGPARFRFRGSLRGPLARSFFCGRLFDTHTRPSPRLCYRSG
jgi:hypothetical protein